MKAISCLILAASTVFAATVAQAHDNRELQGQMTVFNPVHLIDRDHNNREIFSAPYKVFISNDHKNITFNRSGESDSQRIVIDMPSGMGDLPLDTFTLPASALSQGYDLLGTSNFSTTNGSSYTEYRRCYESNWYGNQQFQIQTSISTHSFTLIFSAAGQVQAQFQGNVSSDQTVVSSAPISACQLVGPLNPGPYYPGPYYPGRPYPGPGYPGPGYYPGGPYPGPGVPHPGAVPLPGRPGPF